MNELASEVMLSADAFSAIDTPHRADQPEPGNSRPYVSCGSSHLRTSHYGKERVVFKQGAPANSIFQIESGAVLVLRNEGSGPRRLLEVLGAGCFFGVTSGPRYDCQAETMVPTVLRQISRAHVERAPDLKSRIVEQRVQQLEELRSSAQALTGKTALQRVATFLWHLPDAERSTACQPGAFRAAPNQQDIASYLGLSASTVCRCMRRLQRDNVICGLGRTRIVVLDRDRLAELAAKSYSELGR